MFFRKRNKSEERYTIAFCSAPDLSTEFGHEYEFASYESAVHTIFSKACGWGHVIAEKKDDMARVDDAWLIVRRTIRKKY